MTPRPITRQSSVIRPLAVFFLVLAALAGVPAQAFAARPLTIDGHEVVLGAANAADVLEDPSAALTIDDVSREPWADRFAPLGDRVPSWGRTDSALWFRYTLVNDTDAPRTTFLTVMWSRLEQVDCFVAQRGGLIHHHSGWFVPFAERPRPVPSHSFPLELLPHETLTVHLRIHTRTEIQAQTFLRNPTAELNAVAGEARFAGIFLGMVLVVVLGNAIVFARLRQPFHLHYVVSVASFAVYWLLAAGYAGATPVARWGYVFPMLLGMGWTFFRLAFTRSFLDSRRFAPHWDRALRGMQVVTLLEVPLVLLARPLGISLGTLDAWDANLSILFSIVALVVGVVCWRRGQPRAGWLVLAQGIFAAGLGIGILLFAGLIRVHPLFAGIPMMLGIVLEMLVLNVVLADAMWSATAAKEQALARVQIERLESLRGLVAGVVHELNSPIGTLRSSADTLRRLGEKLTIAPGETKLAATLRAVTETTGSASARVDEIVRSLRTFARLDESELKRVDLHEGLDSALMLLAPALGARIRVEKSYGELPLVECRAGELNQVFLAVLQNAIQAIDGEGTLRVSTRMDADTIIVTLEDTGRGIPAAALRTVFEPQLTRRGPRVKMALGLSTSRSIVLAHGGELTLESREGEGTRVELRLPTRGVGGAGGASRR